MFNLLTLAGEWVATYFDFHLADAESKRLDLVLQEVETDKMPY